MSNSILYNAVRFILKPFRPKREIFHFVFTKAVTQTSTNKILYQLRKHLQEKPKVLMLSINSAYGDMIQAQIVAEAFQQASKNLDAPLYTFIDDYALGPGYYLASCGTRVYANPFSLIGEVQPCRKQMGFQNLLETFRISHQTTMKEAILLNAFTQVTEKQKEFLEKEMQLEFQETIQEIQKNRGIQLGSELGNTVYTAEVALQKGLVDEISTFDQVLAKQYPNFKFRELTIFKDDQAQIMVYGQLQLAIETILNKLQENVEITDLSIINDTQDQIAQLLSQALQNTDMRQIAQDMMMDYLNDFIVNQY